MFIEKPHLFEVLIIHPPQQSGQNAEKSRSKSPDMQLRQPFANCSNIDSEQIFVEKIR